MAIDTRLGLAVGQIESPLLGLARGIESGTNIAAQREAMAASQQRRDILAQEQETISEDRQRQIALRSVMALKKYQKLIATSLLLGL